MATNLPPVRRKKMGSTVHSPEEWAAVRKALLEGLSVRRASLKTGLGKSFCRRVYLELREKGLVE